MALRTRQKAVSNRPALAHKGTMGWATIVIFVLGIGNFALQQAVLDSGHPLVRRLPFGAGEIGRRAAVATEFAVLLFALLLSANGWPGFVWAYAAYTGFNAVAAWLILGGKV